MACMNLGSKSDVFHLDGGTWVCSTGLPSDVTFEVKDVAFRLHKFPLISRSGMLENVIEELLGEDERCHTLQLHDIPGGPETFLLVAKFCYGVRMELNAPNVVGLRCAAEYLRMTDEYGEGNLISQTENFLNEVFSKWNDSIKALETCDDVLPYAEELHIVSRCIGSLAMKACADQCLFSWPMSSDDGALFWNGIRTMGKQPPYSEDWWYEDISCLKLPLFKRFISDVEGRGMKPERISGAIMHYVNKHLPLLGRQSSSTLPSPFDGDHRAFLEEIVEVLPNVKGVMPTRYLLRLLRTSMILNTNPDCRESLERRIGAQLEQAALEDLMIPNTGYSTETLYDVDCVQRILDHFMVVDRETSSLGENYIVEERQLTGDPDPLNAVTTVANLIDGYLAEVAPDVNLKPPKFLSLATAIPEYARLLDDGIYRAIDTYLKAHYWLTDSEREQLCRLMNCQKLSMEASTHAAQNERLPLRVIVQVLFFEQLRLRTSMLGWFSAPENANENSQKHDGSVALARAERQDQSGMPSGEVRERVDELEKECVSIRRDLQKLGKTKGSWNIFSRTFGLKTKPKPCGKTSSCKDKTAVMAAEDVRRAGDL